MKTFGSRLKAAREAAKLTQADLANKFDPPISRNAVSLWESDTGFPEADKLQVIGRVLKVSVDHLLMGQRLSPINDTPVNFTDGPPIRARVPVVSWAAAGSWSDVEDPFRPGEAEEWVNTLKSVSPSAFALRVIGDSMEPTIPANSLVVIDPAASPAHGRIVLAKRTGDQQATLKMLWYDGATPMLKPLNARYSIMDMPQDTKIIGVAVHLFSELP